MRNLLWIGAAALLSFASPSGIRREPTTNAEVIFAPTGNKRILQNRISRELQGARKQILVAMYQFTSETLAQALIAAHRRGVEVRVLLDGRQAAERGWYARAREILKNAKIPVRFVYPDGIENEKSKKSKASLPKFHHKFCVLDGGRVITGSYNWTVLADEENHENLVIATDRALASTYAARFDEIWEDEKITKE